ncbi:MAG: hypothetical protein WA152_02255 [Microgenomates group bacterium]
MKSLAAGLIIIILGGSVLYYYKNTKTTITQNVSRTAPSPIPTNKAVEFSATFKIITNGTTRIFTDSKYHNLSDVVYITSKDPNKVEVRKENITWSDFFKTLPMNLDKNCLVTGAKQTFCTNETKKLYFYLNDVETPDALDNLIKENDYLLVEYK